MELTPARHHWAQIFFAIATIYMTITIEENVPLAPYTTFKIGGPARYFCLVKNAEEMAEAVVFARVEKVRILVLGGGSNILVSDAGYSGLVIKNEILGRKVIGGNADHDLVAVGAGENWDNFVEWSIDQGYCGLENLSAIPGTVGAAPVQNIGAYGVEVGSFIESVRVYDSQTMDFQNLKHDDCQFEYRDSLFKKDKGRYVIIQVIFRLKKNRPVNIEYHDLQKYFAGIDRQNISPLQVRNAVMSIRADKLPDWKNWGTAGSFFKNPIISGEKFQKIKLRYPNISGYKQPDGRIKVSAAWILDNICRAKGLFEGNVGTYTKQALVLVTKPGATASDVVEFSNKLLRTVETETGIKMESEVDWVN